MEIKFFDTTVPLKINGHDFIIDVGEEETAKAAATLLELAGEGSPDGGLNEKIKARIDELLGPGAADRIMEGRSATNDLIFRHLALSLARAIGSGRTDILVKAMLDGDKDEPGKNAAGETVQ